MMILDVVRERSLSRAGFKSVPRKMLEQICRMWMDSALSPPIKAAFVCWRACKSHSV